MKLNATPKLSLSEVVSDACGGEPDSLLSYVAVVGLGRVGVARTASRITSRRAAIYFAVVLALLIGLVLKRPAPTAGAVAE